MEVYILPRGEVQEYRDERIVKKVLHVIRRTGTTNERVGNCTVSGAAIHRARTQKQYQRIHQHMIRKRRVKLSGVFKRFLAQFRAVT